MKIAYLIFGYKNPRLLQQTTTLLSGSDAGFFVHIDRKSDLREFSGIAAEHVIFTRERVKVQWAEFSGVEAILVLIRHALASINRYDYFVLLSGSEYPLRSPHYIQRYFEENAGREFMNLVRVPNEAAGKPLSRIERIVFPSEQPVRRLAFRALARLGLGKRDHRKYFGGLEPYAGSTWWALTRNACQYVLAFAEQEPHITGLFRAVFAPEESFFHTVLGNSQFRERVKRNVLYEDWSARSAHPSMITERHIDAFEKQDKVWLDDIWGAGEALFARKFSDERLDLAQRVENMIDRKDGVRPA